VFWKKRFIFMMGTTIPFSTLSKDTYLSHTATTGINNVIERKK
jgi:hypothetical protein